MFPGQTGLEDKDVASVLFGHNLNKRAMHSRAFASVSRSLVCLRSLEVLH
jgi:hypothetical protein